MMKPTTHKIYFLVLLGLSILGSSCARYYYQPNAVNMPMLSEQHDASVSFGGAMEVSDIDGDIETRKSVSNIQLAYSPLKYVGLMTNLAMYRYRVADGKEDFDAGRVNAHANLLEAGAGGYYPVLTNSWMKLVADGYVGYGGGRLRSDVNMNFDRIFIQPGFNMNAAYFDVGIATRISGIKYGDFDANGRPDTYIENRRLENITDNRHWFLEPTITLRGGYKFIKGQLQLVAATPFSDVPWEFNQSHTSISLFFDIDEAIRMARGR